MSKRIVDSFFVFLAVSISTAVAQPLSISDIQVFQRLSTLNPRGDEDLAIDDDNGTVSFLTPAFTNTPHIAALDLGSLVEINRFRADKGGDTDGTGAGAPGLEPVDNMDLQLLYSIDSGPLEHRSYLPVSGLSNGYNGSELIMADAINAADATVDNDHHDSAIDGLYSLSFDNVQATALGLRFARDAGDGAPWTHYFAWELDAMLDGAERPIDDIEVFAAPAIGRQLNTRNDAANAIDGDNSTWSFITPSGTTGPHIAGLDMGEPMSINRLRIDKWGDTDDAGPNSGAPGIEPVDNMDLQLLFTNDSGPLHTRTYEPVTGLTNGYQGRETINADGIDSVNATVDNDHHDTLDDGIFSLSFDSVEATGFGLRFERDANDSTAFTHYRVWEMELLENDTTRNLTNIQVFEAELPSLSGVELNNRGDEHNAVDGDLGTASYLTPSFTDQENTAALDLGGPHMINRLRVAKGGDTDSLQAGAPGLEPIDNMDLEILVTTDSGPLEERNYTAVTGLASGFDGSEFIEADEVNADGTVDNDHHDFDLDGWYSLTFDPVQATAVAIRFARDDDDSAPWTHYFAYELEVYAADTMLGDFNFDGVLNVEDIDQLVWQVASQAHDPAFDVNSDGNVNRDDIRVWAKELANGWIGDANVDGEFNSGDLVAIFQAGKFEQDVEATWSEGDWTGDHRFDSGDLVAAFQDGGFEVGVRPLQAVPEPGGFMFLLLAALTVRYGIACRISGNRLIAEKQDVDPT